MNDLPTQIPIFPLTGVILMPKGHLPLNIFEPRYKEMIKYAQKTHNIIGMIQSSEQALPLCADENDLFGTAKRGRSLYNIGCAGLISDFEETDEGQYFIILTGLCRFKIIEEIPMKHTFREVGISYDDFKNDGNDPSFTELSIKENFRRTLSRFLSTVNIKIDLDLFDDVREEEFINSMAMICPFDTTEKQLLLETPILSDRIALMIKIMEFRNSGQIIPQSDILH